jgi:tRNA(Glu) U13 pseudouridine synthase TruD
MRKEIIALAPNWSQVLEKLNEFPLVFPSEIKVVEHLTKNPTDFRGALQKIEEQVVLWVSALASLLYNRKVSSYIIAGIEPPKRLPLFLSFDKNDWLPYSDDLEGAGVFPPNLNNLRPFPRITLMHKDIETKDHADILGAEVVPEGIIVNFTLGKGEYATTFLSHFVTLLNGKPSDDTTESVIDIKEKLNQTSLAETLKYFEALNQPK